MIRCPECMRQRSGIHTRSATGSGRVETPDDRWWQWPTQSWHPREKHGRQLEDALWPPARVDEAADRPTNCGSTARWAMPSGAGADNGPPGLLDTVTSGTICIRYLGPCPAGSTVLRRVPFNAVGKRPLDRRDLLFCRHPPFATNFGPTRTNRPLSGGSRQSTRFAFST